ncbi:MAG: hypothetical protein ACP5KN_00265 [Armatimonadota bacterium]
MRVLPLLGIMACSLWPAAATNMLANGQFEGVFGRTGIASGWVDNSYSSKGPIEITWGRETDNVHSGASCQRATIERIGFITPRRTGHAHHGALQLLAEDDVNLREGRVYRVRAAVRADRTMPIEVILRLRGEPWTKYMYETVVAGPHWREVDFLFTSTVSDPRTGFFVRCDYLGTLYVDDASVAELTADEVAAASGAPVEGNLLHNGSFDLGRANWLGERGWDTVHDASFSVEDIAGDPCLKVSVAAGLPKAVVSDVIPVSPGRPIRVSCRVRAGQPTDVELTARYMSRKHAMPIYCSATKRVGTEWMTMEAEGHVAFRPGEPHAFIYLTFTGPGPLWVDDVVIRQDHPSAARPITRAAIVPDRYPAGRYHGAERPTVRLLASVPGGDAPVLRWQIRDYWDHVVAMGRWTPAPGRAATDVELPELPPGFYHASLRWQADGRALRNESTFCILPPTQRSGTAQTSPFGAHFQAGPVHTDLAAAVGARWVRLWPPYLTVWRTVEPDDDQWRWRDEEVQRLVDEGFSIVGMFERAPDWAQRGMAGYWEAWEQYVARVVERYRDRIDVWEVQNEPNLRWWMEEAHGGRRAELHVEALEHAYPIVKRIDPEATVIGGSVAGLFSEGTDALAFTREVIGLGGLELMDVLSFHFYHSHLHPLPMDEEQDAVADAVTRVKSIMRDAGRQIPIINSEGGTFNPAPVISYRPVAPDNVDPLSAEAVAVLAVRQYIAQWAAGVERFLYYNFAVDGSPVAKTWDSFVEGDGQPRPVVAAYATMTWLLDGATFEGTERPTGDLWLHHFRTPRGPLVVAWTRTGTTATYEFQDAVGAWDIVGADLPLEPHSLLVRPEPTYVLLQH